MTGRLHPPAWPRPFLPGGFFHRHGPMMEGGVAGGAIRWRDPQLQGATTGGGGQVFGGVMIC